MYEWQEKILNGFSKGEKFVISLSRQSGKSYVNEMVKLYNQKFYKVDGPVDVDNEPWYTVKCDLEIALWIRTLDKSLWHEHQSTIPLFDINNAVYLMLQLKWK